MKVNQTLKPRKPTQVKKFPENCRFHPNSTYTNQHQAIQPNIKPPKTTIHKTEKSQNHNSKPEQTEPDQTPTTNQENPP